MKINNIQKTILEICQANPVCDKTFITENMGVASTDSIGGIDRWLPGITVENKRGEAPIASKSAAWGNLLSICSDLAGYSEENGIPLYFDLFPVQHSPISFIFRTMTEHYGADRTNLVFSTDSGNLSAAQITRSMQDVITRLYVGGDGSGSSRTLIRLTNANLIDISEYAKIEAFFDERDIGATDVLTAEGNTELNKRSLRMRFEGSASDIDRFIYGLDYGFGDAVTVSALGQTFRAIVTGISFRFENGEEVSRDVRLIGDQLNV